MTLNLITIATIALLVFGAIWFFFVVPAEKRHHERKMGLIQKKLEQREAQRLEIGSVEDRHD